MLSISSPIDADTICAIATAPGGALGIVRLSGPQAIAIADKAFKPAAGLPLAQRAANSITFGNFYDKNGVLLDEVLVSLFRAPHAYTGEDSIEISCHGSAYIMRRILETLVDSGARIADPGEYTKRAFVNGKMDLSQAEAVADLIAASSAAAHRMALNQMRGNYSSELGLLRDQLLHIATLMELELDFSDHEELEFADRHELRALAARIEQRLSGLCRSFHLGNVLKQGLPVAIVGETNAGKSTLLNALLGEDRAIVSDIHGTTRDAIEDTTVIDGITFRFIDTAGIRDTADAIESIGIERTFAKIDKAEIILWVLDTTDGEEQFRRLLPRLLPHFAGVPGSTASDSGRTASGTGSPKPAAEDWGAGAEGLSAGAEDSVTKADDVVTVAEDSAAKSDDLITKTDSLVAGVDSRLIVLLNKADLTPASSLLALEDFIRPQLPQSTPLLSISAQRTTDITRLQSLLSSLVPHISEEEIIVSNGRHYASLTAALAAIRRVSAGLSSTLPTDLVSQDLHECLHYLAEITGGIITPNEVLESVFSHFCIGK